MQTPKARNSSSGAPQKTSPRSSNVPHKTSPRAGSVEASLKISPRVVRQLKTPGRDSNKAASSLSPSTRVSKERSPKVVDRVSPKSPVTEKKHRSRVSELESQISTLENDLKSVKDQLCSSEEAKKKAQKDAEEYSQQLSTLSFKLEESQNQLLKGSVSKKSQVTEVSESSEKGEKALQSEVEAIEKQNSIDPAALATSLDEIKQLKFQLGMVTESEARLTKYSDSAQEEINRLKEKLVETVLLVEDMKQQLKDCKESEAQAQALVGETLMQLETAKKTVKNLRAEGSKAIEEYDAIASELDQSRAHVNYLEELVSKLKADINNAGRKNSHNNLETSENGRTGKLIETELDSVKLEVEQLRSALEAAEIRYNEEQARNAEQMTKAYEMIESLKSSSKERVSGLELELRRSKEQIDELKANLMDKETELQGICEENEELAVRLESTLSGKRDFELKGLEKSKEDIETVKANLIDKQTELRNLSNENESLKLEINKANTEGGSDRILSQVEAARAAESEALMKVGYMTEEVDKSNRRAARVAEQLEAAQTANAEMEAELRRLKVQSDQWRKAAETAAAMLSAGNNGILVERTGAIDYSPRNATKLDSPPYADELDDDDVVKKKNANMLRRLWKK